MTNLEKLKDARCGLNAYDPHVHLPFSSCAKCEAVKLIAEVISDIEGGLEKPKEQPSKRTDANPIITPLERAQEIARKTWLGAESMRGQRMEELADQIHKAILEYANEEVSRRRAAELQLEGIGPAVIPVHTATGSVLRAYNPVRQEWHEVSMVGVAPGVNKA